MFVAELFECPHGVLADLSAPVGRGGSFQGCDSFERAGIPEGDRHIASELVPGGSAQRAALHQTLVVSIGEAKELQETWSPELFLRAKFAVRWRLVLGPIVRTHVLANVATKYAITERRPEFRGNVSGALYGEVRDAASCIEFPGALEGLRRTGVEAGCAGSAGVGTREARGFVRFVD